MRYLAVTIACEGPTDWRYLRSLVPRVVEQVLLDGSGDTVEVGVPLPLLRGEGHDARFTNKPDVVTRQVRAGSVMTALLVVHADAGGAPERIRSTIVDIIKRDVENAHDSVATVGAVPQRETEAWMLADVQALSQALGVSEGIVRVSCSPTQIHSVRDPKAELRTVVEHVETGVTRRTSVRRARDRLNALYAVLGRTSSLRVLREVPSFACFYADIETRLAEKGYLR